MPYCRHDFREFFCCGAVLAGALALALAGCSDTCFVGFASNGKGGVAVAAGNLPSACTPPRVNGAVRVLALKSPACETCAPDARAVHIFVTVSGIELEAKNLNGTGGGDWLEIAPQLRTAPRQIDLVGDEPPEILVDSAGAPAGAYRAVRLEFYSGFQSEPGGLPAESACGGTRWNCVVLADGHAEAIRWPDEAPELLLAIERASSGSAVVLPDAGLDLRLTLEPQWVSDFSDTRSWRFEGALAGSASLGPRWSLREAGRADH